MDLILVVHLLKGSWSAKHHWSKTLPVRTGAKAEARFQHLRALPSVYDLIMLELRNEVYLVWCCFFRLMLLTFLVGVWGGGSFCFWGGDLFVSVASHLFILGIINSETHSGSPYYSYGQMGSFRTPSYHTSCTLTSYILYFDLVKPRFWAPTRGSPPHLGWLPASQDLPMFSSLHQMTAHQLHPSVIFQGLFTSSA